MGDYPSPEKQLPSMIPDTSKTVVLYPLWVRNAERDKARAQQRQIQLAKRRYWVSYELNRGYGPKRFTGYYNFYLVARFHAWLGSLWSKTDLTHIELTQKW